MPDIDTAAFKPFVRKLVEASETVILPFFGSDSLEVERKSDDTPVTIADRKAEEVMRRLINGAYPKHGIVGEELGEENPDAEFVWVLDPIDGTKSFAAGIPLFGTLICLKYQGQPILGAINQPVLKQCVMGDENGTSLNGKPVRVSQTERLEEALLLTTDCLRPRDYKDGAAFDRLARKCHMFRTWGDAYGYLMVATGRADIMTDPILAEWDFVGNIPLIRGAGGVVTNWEGGDPVGGESVVTANPTLHPQVMEILHDQAYLTNGAT
jgi:myo-inositol-1(or 4)-monophosphatase